MDTFARLIASLGHWIRDRQHYDPFRRTLELELFRQSQEAGALWLEIENAVISKALYLGTKAEQVELLTKMKMLADAGASSQSMELALGSIRNVWQDIREKRMSALVSLLQTEDGFLAPKGGDRVFLVDRFSTSFSCKNRRINGSMQCRFTKLP